MRLSDYIWRCRSGHDWFTVLTPDGRRNDIGPFPTPFVLFPNEVPGAVYALRVLIEAGWRPLPKRG